MIVCLCENSLKNESSSRIYNGKKTTSGAGKTGQPLVKE